MKVVEVFKKLVVFYLIFWVSQCMTLNIEKPEFLIISQETQQLKKYFKWINDETYSIIKEKCRKYKLDILLVCSLIQYESGSYCGNDLEWMKRVKSHAGAIGIMQIMPFHSKNPKTLLNSEINIEKGCWYLSLCVKKAKKLKYKNIIIASTRMYNAGLGNKHWEYKNWKYTTRINKLYNKVKNNSNKMYLASI